MAEPRGAKPYEPYGQRLHLMVWEVFSKGNDFLNLFWRSFCWPGGCVVVEVPPPVAVPALCPHGGAHAGRCELSKKLFQEEKQNPAAPSNSRCAEQESHGAGQSRPCCAVCVLLGSLSCEVASHKEVVPSWCSLLCVEELSLQHKPSLAEQNECPQCTINPFAKWWLSQWFHRVPLPEEKLLSPPWGSL